MEEVYKTRKFRLSNGEVYEQKSEGIMPSGWYLTYLANSIFQVVVDVFVKQRMNLSLDVIKAESFVGGGDDVNQTFNAVDKDQYIKVAAAAGFEIKLVEHDGLMAWNFSAMS